MSTVTHLAHDHKIIEDSAREFAKNNILPHVMEWDESQHFPMDLMHQLGQQGFLGILVPEEYDGSGLGYQEYITIITEIAKVCGSIGLSLAAHNSLCTNHIYMFGTEEQKREHLIPMMRGQWFWCQGFSEPNAGSDLASLKTSARLEGDEFVVNGSKIWTSDGDQADWMYALVRTDTTVKKQQGISFLLIDMHAPGVTVKPIELISGKSHFCEVFFDNVRVPARQLVGPLNGGWTVAKKLLQHEREAMSKFSEGGAPSPDALALGRPYLFDEEGTLREPVWRDRLAGLLMDSHAFALTVQRVKEEALAGQDVSGPASIMKLVQTEQEVAKGELLTQLMGHRGMSWEGDEFSRDEHDATRFWLRSKTYTIAGGSSEIQLNVIARRVLGLPG